MMQDEENYYTVPGFYEWHIVSMLPYYLFLNQFHVICNWLTIFSDHLKECTNCRNEYRSQRLAQHYAIIRGECSSGGMATTAINNASKGTEAAS
jgi:hypothetical protein